MKPLNRQHRAAASKVIRDLDITIVKVGFIALDSSHSSKDVFFWLVYLVILNVCLSKNICFKIYFKI